MPGAISGSRMIERAIALDEANGRILWTREWEANYSGLETIFAVGPRATPTVDGNRVYVLGTMGNLLALDVGDGRVLWQKDFVKDFDASVPSWGMTSAPLVDGDRLIAVVGGEPNAKVMAFNKLTGDEIWRALSSDWEPGYNQPIIIEAAAHAAADHLASAGRQLAQSRDRRGLLGSSLRGRSGDDRRDAGAQRRLPARLLVLQQREDVEARRGGAGGDAGCGGVTTSRSRRSSSTPVDRWASTSTA